MLSGQLLLWRVVNRTDALLATVQGKPAPAWTTGPSDAPWMPWGVLGGVLFAGAYAALTGLALVRLLHDDGDGEEEAPPLRSSHQPG